MLNRDAKAIIGRASERDLASVTEGLNNRPNSVVRLTLDLSNEVPKEKAQQINYPFKSFFLESASDPSAFLYMRPITNDDIQGAFKVTQRDSYSVEYKIPTAYLHWPAQPGKSVTLVFFADAEFRSGSQISVTSGGLAIVDGSSLTTLPQASVGLVPTKIISADPNRKVANLYHAGTEVIWLGDPTVAGANNGIPFLPGETKTFRNTGELWGITTGVAQNVNIMTEQG